MKTEKLCTKCNNVKAINDFYINRKSGCAVAYCKVCMSAYYSELYRNNRQRIDNRVARWRHTDLGKECVKMFNITQLHKSKLRYRIDHKDNIYQYKRLWNQTFRGKMSRKAADHRRRLLEAGLDLETVQRVYEDNVKKYGTLTCCLCFDSVAFGEDSLEHLIPLVRREEFPNVDINGYDNLGVSHRTCNSKKGILTIDEWFELHSEHLFK